jgi:anti-sigma factor ChrR (cupin superfamily)
LSIDRVVGRRSFLVRRVPGSCYGHHEHPQDEECIVLEGDLRFGDLQLSAGDYHLARAGVPHPTAVSRGGCLLFISCGL